MTLTQITFRSGVERATVAPGILEKFRQLVSTLTEIFLQFVTTSGDIQYIIVKLNRLLVTCSWHMLSVINVLPCLLTSHVSPSGRVDSCDQFILEPSAFSISHSIRHYLPSALTSFSSVSIIALLRWRTESPRPLILFLNDLRASLGIIRGKSLFPDTLLHESTCPIAGTARLGIL